MVKKGNVPWNKGKTGVYSEEVKKKMGAKNIGRKASAEVRKKMSKAQKGKIPWNKGKTGIYTEKQRKSFGRLGRIVSTKTRKKISVIHKGKILSKSTKKKISLSKKGTPAWNKGKTGIYTEKQREQIRKSLKKLYAEGYVSPNKGLKRSAEFKKKVSLSKKGNSPAWNIGIPLAESSKEKIREARRHQVLPVKDTKPERDLQKLLKDLEIKFEKHKAILGQPDVFVKPNICIFVDGDYWHANPKNFINKGKLYPGFKKDDFIIGNLSAKTKWARDKSISQRLKKQGYVVIRFWQSELETKREKCIKKVLTTVLKIH